MGYRVVVVGSLNIIGHEILKILSERQFPIDEIQAVAPSISMGQKVSFGDDQTLNVIPVTDFDFRGYDFAFFSAGPLVSAEFVPIAAEAGCIVIDTSPHFRQVSQIPLIVPEVNADVLENSEPCSIITSPNCAAIALAMALKPLHEEAGVRRVVVSTYQAVSGAGRAAMDELFNQTRSIYTNQPLVKEEFSKQIAFNCIPQCYDFTADGSTLEETRIAQEIQKVLGVDLGIAVTCVRVPVFIGHSMSVAVELENSLSVGEARALWREFPGLSIVDYRQEDGYVTPIEAIGEDDVFISRIRKDKSIENGLLFWLVTDNLRKGAALNAVQIAEAVVERAGENYS